MPELSESFEKVEDAERRSTIERIVTSYRHPWDVYAELIQNAVDAIYDEAERISSGEFLGNLILRIDTGRRTVSITDNGIGVPADKIGSLIATGKSLKRDSGKRYGFMGFGLTFLAFQTSYFRVESIHDGKKSVRTYHNLYKYVFGASLTALPEAEEDGRAPVNTNEPNGTTFTLEFPAEFPRDDKEHDIAEAFKVPLNKALFIAALRTKTAVGNVQKIFGKKALAEIVVIVAVNDESYEVDFKYLDYAEVLKTLDYQEGQMKSLEAFNRLVEETKDEPLEQQQQKRREIAIFHKEVGLSVGQRNPLKFDMYVFATSKSILNTYNHRIGATVGDEADDQTGWGISSGVLLSIDGMPSGIRLDGWTHPSYFPFTVLIDAGNISHELDAGRKGISMNRRDQIMRLVTEKLSALKLLTYSKYVTLGGESPKSLETRKDAYIKRFGELGKVLNGNSAVYTPPVEEQEVIALFFDLLGRGHIKGYRLKMQSAYHTYDALMDYRLSESDGTRYDARANPLGILGRTFAHSGGILEKENAIVEFKQSLNTFYDDFKQLGHAKDVGEIDVLVCWTVQDNPAAKYGDSVAPIRPNERHYFGATHAIIMSSRSKPLHVIALKDVLETLECLVMDPVSVATPT